MPTLFMVGVKTLGRSIALHFARQGWRVVAVARTVADVDAVAAAVSAAGGEGVAAPAGLQDPASLARAVETAGSIDLCVAAQTAGGRFGSKPLLDIDVAELAQQLAAYPGGAWNLLKAVGPVLVGQGRGTFLQIGTSSGVRTKDGFAALGAAQHALRALVQVAAREWRLHGVHVAYLPVDGPIASVKTAAWLAGMGPGRAISEEAIAQACAYLHAQERDAWTHELLLRPTTSDWTTPT